MPQEGVRLIGHNVSVGSVRNAEDIARINHAARFASTVNSKGMRVGSGIQVRNGSIQIVAANDASINTRVYGKQPPQP